MNTLQKLLCSVACAVALVACSSPVKLDETGAGAAPVDDRSAGAGAGAGMSSGTTTAGGDSRQVAPVSVDTRDALDDPNSPLAKRSIFFDFNSFVIREEFRSTLEAHARYLNATKSRRMVIQGNTDERGSREYNLALGQKRAEAVRKALAALGVGDNQIEAVSLGEEKPRSTGNDDAARADNRRADLVYQ